MTSYNMGQYRFSSSDSYKTEISIPNSAIGYYLKTSKHEFTENDSVLVTDHSLLQPNIYINYNFEKGSTYSLNLNFLNSLSYNINYEIKLCKSLANVSNGLDNCQYIGNFSVTPESVNSSSKAIAFIDPSNTNSVLVKGITVDSNDLNNVFWDGGSNYFWQNLQVEKFNDSMSIPHIWEKTSSTTTTSKQILFTPMLDNINYLVIDIEHTEIDNNIEIPMSEVIGKTFYYGGGTGSESYSVSEGSSNLFGRWIDQLSQENVFNLSKMTNLIDGTRIKYADSSVGIQRIGIWGRSELGFTINGEPLEIGPTEYFELSNFDIKSLTINAESIRDTFVIDYQYKIN